MEYKKKTHNAHERVYKERLKTLLLLTERKSKLVGREAQAVSPQEEAQRLLAIRLPDILEEAH